LTDTFRKLWKKESTQTLIVLALIFLIVFGFWYGSQIALNTNIPPALAVVSGSMCIPYYTECDGWAHPFSRTLHVGDIIIIQGVNSQDLNANYPDSDIIVFHRPGNPDELIVHRIVAKQEISGKWYFFTKGDGNSPPDVWPTVPDSIEYDKWFTDNASIPQGAVSQDLIVGKVVMRIPWIGQIAIFMHETLGVNNSLVGIPIIVILIILLIIIEYAAPMLKKKNQPKQEKSAKLQM
jgi:hypothetical protein